MNSRLPLFSVAAALAIAAAPLPYAYYQPVRWTACAAFCWSAWESRSSGAWPWLLAAFAVLFNPVAPIRMSKPACAVADLVAAAVLALSASRGRRAPRTLR